MDEHEEFCKAADERATKAEAENAKLREEVESYKRQLQEWYVKLQGTDDNWKETLLQALNQQKLLETLLEFGENAGNWTGDIGSSAWNMTPDEDKRLDKLWDEVRAILSKPVRPANPNPDCRWCKKGWPIQEIRLMHQAQDTGEFVRCEDKVR